MKEIIYIFCLSKNILNTYIYYIEYLLFSIHTFSTYLNITFIIHIRLFIKLFYFFKLKNIFSIILFHKIEWKNSWLKIMYSYVYSLQYKKFLHICHM